MNLQMICHSERSEESLTCCSFPLSPTTINRRGINHTDWLPLDRATYDAHLDRRDYRPKQQPTKGSI